MRKTLLILMWIFIPLICFYLLTERWQPPKEEVPGGHLTTARPGKLQVRGWVADNRVKAGMPVTFWISFANDSSDPVICLRIIALEASEFVKEGTCWADGVPVCQDGNRVVFPLTLPPGANATLSGPLRAPEHSGTFAPTVVFAWSGRSGAELRDALTLGPIEVISQSRERALYFFTRAHQILKDIVLPAALVAIGFLFQKATQRHSEQTKLAEEKRTLKNQIWQNLLAQSLADAQKYYLPLLTPLNRLRRLIPEAQRGSSQAREKCFYNLMLLMCRMNHLADHIGGVQFRNRRGERIVSLAYYAFSEEIEEEHRFGSERKALALRSVRPREDFAEFQAHFAPEAGTHELFVALRSGFEKWVNDTAEPFGRYAALLDVMYFVIAYEVNRPFEYWYGEPEAFPEVELGKANEGIKQLAKKASEEVELSKKASEEAELSGGKAILEKLNRKASLLQELNQELSLYFVAEVSRMRQDKLQAASSPAEKAS